jgi:hypothetical protein
MHRHSEVRRLADQRSRADLDVIRVRADREEANV